jgi:hypothetical protein
MRARHQTLEQYKQSIRMQQLMSEQSLIDSKSEVVEGKGWSRMVVLGSNLHGTR